MIVGKTYRVWQNSDNLTASFRLRRNGTNTYPSTITYELGDEVNVYVQVKKSSTAYFNEYFNVWVTETANATEYAPYREEHINLPESVLALDGYGLGVNGVYNELDIENGAFIKKTVKRKVSDFTDWEMTSNVDGKYYQATIELFEY